MLKPLDSLGLRPVADSFRPPSAAYVARLETAIGARLPTDYRKFLASHGVCTFTDFVSFALPGGPRVDLNLFFGSDPDDSFDLMEVWRALSDRLPPMFLPFAQDPNGCALCFDLRPETHGTVHFWDPSTDDVSYVTASFAAFLAMLQREPA